MLQKLLGAKSPENAIEIQTAYAKTAYEGFVAQANRMGELFVNLSMPSGNFVADAPATRATENLVPPAPAVKPTAAKPTENLVPQAPAAKPTENFVPQAPTPKVPTPKVPTTKAPIPKAPTTK